MLVYLSTYDLLLLPGIKWLSLHRWLFQDSHATQFDLSKSAPPFYYTLLVSLTQYGFSYYRDFKSWQVWIIIF